MHIMNQNKTEITKVTHIEIIEPSKYSTDSCYEIIGNSYGQNHFLGKYKTHSNSVGILKDIFYAIEMDLSPSYEMPKDDE